MSHVTRFASLIAGLSLLAVGNFAQAADEALPPGAQLVGIEARPAAIELKHRFDYSQLLLMGKLASGGTVDVTRLAKLEQPLPAVEVSDSGLVRPKNDGSGELKFSLAGQSVSVPVRASGIAANHPVSFVREVMPVMSKVGCNAGTCHGSANGKNGFKLSLRGYDPLFDYRALTDDLAARRFNRAVPEQSLMLEKISGAVPHVGGVLTRPGEPQYELLKAWISGGAKFDGDSPRVSKVEIAPTNPIIPLPGMKQQMTVLATYSDGTKRDVTADAFTESGNIEITECSKQGVVTALRRGESAVLVRYEGNYAATTITVMGDRTGFVWHDQPENNYIDHLVYAKLKRVQTSASGLCTDAEFVRRVCLDLTGLPPTVERLQAFLDDPRDTRLKRDELIDALVGSGEYVEHWTNKWADLLQVNSKYLGEEGSWGMRNWIKQAVASNMPYDKFVYNVLTASGSTMQNPPASYYKILRKPDEVMENTTQLFLGVRFSCNKCHDHPFERWTQDQHWKLAAYFAKVARKPDPKFADKKIGGSAVEDALPLSEVIYDQSTGEVRHPNTNAVLAASFPYPVAELPAGHESPREQFARWATSAKNEYFARSYVNRLWSYLVGVGFIEPVDDIRAGNPATNPELLDRLTADFIASGFDVQTLERLICKSRVYQLSIVGDKWNQDDQINYSHALARRLPAEVLYDAVYQVTGSTRDLPGMAAGARAAEQRDSSVNSPDGFLDLFGRPARQSACECERAGGVMLGQTLNLINGPTIANAIAQRGNAVEKLVAAEKDDAKVVEQLFLRVLDRQPTSLEVSEGVASLRVDESDRAKAATELAAYEKLLPARQADWEKHVHVVRWLPLAVDTATSNAGATLHKEADGSLFVDGPLAKDVYTITAHVDLKNITGIRLEALTDSRLPNNGPGRAPSGNAFLSEFRVSTAPAADPAKARPIALLRPLADVNHGGLNIRNAIDGDPKTGWALAALDKDVGQNREAVFEIKPEAPIDGPSIITVTLDQQHPDAVFAFGRFRLSVADTPPPILLKGSYPAEIATELATPSSQRTPLQQETVARYYRSIDQEYSRLSRAATAAAGRVDSRLTGAQDLVWALLNSPAFLFNR